MEDKQLTCIDCKEDFVLTGGEQQFFDKWKMPHPRRCKECRAKRKAQKQESGY